MPRLVKNLAEPGVLAPLFEGEFKQVWDGERGVRPTYLLQCVDLEGCV